MTGFNIVRNDLGGLKSIVGRFSKEWGITYPPGKWVEAPRKSKLFAFKDIKSAKIFLEVLAPLHYELWECEAQGVKKIENRICAMWLAQDLAAFWKGQLLMTLQKPPVGTVWADKIMLLKKLEEG